jgi:ribosomal protein S27AE
VTEITEKEECVNCGEPLDVVAKVEDRVPCHKCGSKGRKRVVTVNERIKKLSEISSYKIKDYDEAIKSYSEFLKKFKKFDAIKPSKTFDGIILEKKDLLVKWKDIARELDTISKHNIVKPKTKEVSHGTDSLLKKTNEKSFTVDANLVKEVNNELESVTRKIEELPKESSEISLIKEVLDELTILKKQTAHSTRNLAIGVIGSFIGGIIVTLMSGLDPEPIINFLEKLH